MSNLKVEASSFLLYGIIVALPASLVGGWLAGTILARKKDDATDDSIVEQDLSDRRRPSGGLALVILLLPILLILAGSLTAQLMPAGSTGVRLAAFLGDKNVALLLAVGVSFVMMKPYLQKTNDQIVAESAAAAGPIILITGAGGAFGSLMGASGISDALVGFLSSLDLSIMFLGFLLSAILRAAQGSATVAIVTASSILANVVGPAGAHPLTVGLAICCGGMCGSFPNDSGFWVVSRFGGLTVPQTLRAWTLCSTVGGITGLLVTLLIDQWIT